MGKSVEPPSSIPSCWALVAPSVIHSSGDVYHIWVGDEREEKLIKLIKEEK